MLWCLPRIGNIRSKQFFDAQYKENIKKFSYKIVDLIEIEPIKNFCMETISKTNHVPIHCIDYISFYLERVTYEISFCGFSNKDYLGFNLDPSEAISESDLEMNCDLTPKAPIKICLNMEYFFELGLGSFKYKMGQFSTILKIFISDKQIINHILSKKNSTIYKIQLINIHKNPKKFFGEEFTITEEISNLISNIK